MLARSCGDSSAIACSMLGEVARDGQLRAALEDEAVSGFQASQFDMVLQACPAGGEDFAQNSRVEEERWSGVEAEARVRGPSARAPAHHGVTLDDGHHGARTREEGSGRQTARTRPDDHHPRAPFRRLPSSDLVDQQRCSPCCPERLPAYRLRNGARTMRFLGSRFGYLTVLDADMHISASNDVLFCGWQGKGNPAARPACGRQRRRSPFGDRTLRTVRQDP